MASPMFGPTGKPMFGANGTPLLCEAAADCCGDCSFLEAYDGMIGTVDVSMPATPPLDWDEEFDCCADMFSGVVDGAVEWTHNLDDTVSGVYESPFTVFCSFVYQLFVEFTCLTDGTFHIAVTVAYYSGGGGVIACLFGWSKLFTGTFQFGTTYTLTFDGNNCDPAFACSPVGWTFGDATVTFTEPV